MDLDRAIWAFEYFDQFTRWFPIRVRRAPTTGNMWAVDMLVSYLSLKILSITKLLKLAHDENDPGMRISSSTFALGKSRAEFDKMEGLS
jgi:hypothetical protein